MSRASPDLIDPVILAVLVPVIVIGVIIFFYSLGGFFVVDPKTQVVVLYWGRYRRTITQEGLAFAFPFGRQILRVTSSVVTVDLPKMTVLEASGSPIEVSGICSYRVVEAHKALLEVAEVHHYVALLASAVMKNVCAEYPYESPDPNKPCLRKENEVITRHLIHDLGLLVAPAGVQILQMRINDLTYAPEIAQSMLLRQQAAALVDARRTIVEGAVWTVISAEKKMRDAGLALDAHVVDSFAQNLMLVLCSGERVQTVMPVEIGTVGGGRHG